MIFKKEIEPERKDSSFYYEVPDIVEMDVYIPTHGKYRTPSKRAKGLVVHYTAGRSRAGRQSAISTLRYLGSHGLGCLVMDTDGVIYKGRNQGFDDIAWHAGPSSWKGVSGISFYCMGMEICNAGKLDNAGKSWFGEQYAEHEIRTADRDIENIKAGRYHRYTEAQENSLINFILWQLDTNPEFKIDWVVGHDEICPGRKFDPGYSLSMSMPVLRKMIVNKIAGLF